MALQRSYDRKVSPLIRRQASKDAVVIGNSFGLPGGASCPGRTPFCDGCYAVTLEKVFTSMARLVQRNYDTLLAYGDDVEGLTAELTTMIVEYLAEFDKAFRKGRVTDSDRIFRIHWDGDFYSLAYAQAWANVIRAFPTVTFWAYTRSFEFVPALVDIPNLTLYLSVDKYNAIPAAILTDRYPSLLVAACADTQSDAAEVAVSVTPRVAVKCPENVKRIPLVMSMRGRRTDTVAVGDDAQGACSACGICTVGRRDVAFAVSKG